MEFDCKIFSIIDNQFAAQTLLKLDPFDFIYIVLKGCINAFKLSEKRRLNNIMNVRIMSEVKIQLFWWLVDQM